MPGKIEEFTSTDEFIAKWDELTKAGDFFVVYMTGGIGEDGKSWCPDCDAARPNIT